MSKRLALIVLLILSCSAATWAEGGVSESRLSFSASYFGEMVIHPGVKAGAEYRFLGGERLSLSVPLYLGWYRHIRNHHMLSVESGLIVRLSGKGSLYGDLLLSAGYGLRKPDGSIYVDEEDGTIGMDSAPWRSRFLCAAALGIGFNFGKKSVIKLSPFLRLGAYGEYPYNGYVLPHPFTEAGLRMGLPGNKH
jgi:hypothetical protein